MTENMPLTNNRNSYAIHGWFELEEQLGVQKILLQPTEGSLITV
jgi:hypothetical protein